MGDIPRMTIELPDIGPSCAIAHFAPDATEEEIAKATAWADAYNKAQMARREEVARAYGVGQWDHADTAPKDGTRVLFYVPDWDDPDRRPETPALYREAMMQCSNQFYAMTERSSFQVIGCPF